MAKMENPGALAGATGAEQPIHATADGNQTITPKSSGGTPYRITLTTGEVFRILVKGRDGWALEELRKAGLNGITSYTNPAPRLSAYVHNLRALGVEIETITEPHGGDFAGHHGRYVLRSGVTLDREGAKHD